MWTLSSAGAGVSRRAPMSDRHARTWRFLSARKGAADADSTVPRDWILTYLRYASIDAHAVAGLTEVATGARTTNTPATGTTLWSTKQSTVD